MQKNQRAKLLPFILIVLILSSKIFELNYEIRFSGKVQVVALKKLLSKIYQMEQQLQFQLKEF